MWTRRISKHKNSLFFVSLLGVAASITSSCSPMINIRTDEQAWAQYLLESKSQRLPASNTGSKISEVERNQFDALPLRAILLSCHEVKSPEACFKSKALIAFDGVFKRDPNYKAIQREFLEHYSYQKIYTHVHAFHQTLFSGMEHRAADRAKALMAQCQETDDRVRVEEFTPFLGGNSDIPKAYYRCLNHSLLKDQKELLIETSERLGIQLSTPGAREWITTNHIHPVYERVAKKWFKGLLQDEEQRWKQEKQKFLEQMEKGETLQAVVKRLSPVMRDSYHYLPAEVALTALYRERHSEGKRK